jgi:hypothetical protein
MHPLLEAAIVEVPDEAILAEGLGFERCQMVVFTDSGPEELTASKRVLVESVVSGGAVIVSVAQSWADELAARCRGEERIADLNEALSKDELNQRLAVSAAGWMLRRLAKPRVDPQ